MDFEDLQKAWQSQNAGAKATLYLHAYDQRALTCPEWEEYDGAWPDVMDGTGFRQAHPEIAPAVACVTPELSVTSVKLTGAG